MAGKKIELDTRETVMAMLRAGKSYRVIGNIVGIGIGSVHTIAREATESDLNRMVTELKRGNVARFMMLADYLLDEMTYAVRSNTSVKELAIAAAIMTDKAILLENLQEKKLKARNLALQLGTVVPEDMEPLPEELDVLNEPVERPDNAETMKLINDIATEEGIDFKIEQ